MRLPLRTDPKHAFRGTDQQLARQVGLKLPDFPTGWTIGSAGSEDGTFCPDFHPNDSGLTLTGLALSPSFDTGSAATPSSLQSAFSVVKVWQTPEQASRAFAAEAKLAQIKCVADALPTEPGSQIALVALGRLGFPALGRASRAFRLVIADNSPGGLGQVYADVVFVLGRRSLAAMGFAAIGSPPPLERSLAQRVAARAKRA